MPELVLDRDHRLRLRAQAHHLQPVVLLGAAGLSAPALKEIDRALKTHGLVKIRAPGDDREVREAIAAEIAERLDAALIQLIGKLIVVFRPRPPEETKPARRPASSERPTRAPKKPAPARRSAPTTPPARRRARPG